MSPPPTPVGRTAIDQARAALAGAQDEPAASAEIASALLERHEDPAVRHVALWARGRARHEQGRYAHALEDLHAAATLALASGDRTAAARVAANRALTEYAMGDVPAALASLADAEPWLQGADAGQLHLQRAIVLVHAGELGPARASFDQAHDLLALAGDDAALARCLASRGVACTYLGDFDAAAGDLEAAIDAASRTDQRLVAAGAVHNLGYVRARQGDVPGALELFDQAAAAYRRVGSPARVVASLAQDRAEVLLGAGLLPEAVAAAREAVTRHDEAGADTAATDARLLLAEAELAAGLPTARTTAEAARVRFEADERAAWAARARYVRLRCELLELQHRVTPGGDLVDEATAVADLLSDAGWHTESIYARAVAGEIALATGDPVRAKAVLGPAMAARDAGPVATRVQGWHATALHRLAEGDRGGARRAARRGLVALDEHRTALAGAELRAGVARHGADLARLGLRLALEDRSPRHVLEWTEQSRARALAASIPPAADDDGEQRRLLTALRGAYAQARTEPDAPALQQRIAELERQVRQRDLARRAGGAARTAQPVDARTLRDHLDDEVFVSFTELDRSLWSVVATRRRTLLRALGPTAEVRATVDRLRFACERLARATTARGVAAAFAGFDADRAHLAGLLGLGRLPDQPLVLSPSAAVHGVPWPALPSLVGRPITITPSATVWTSVDHARSRGTGACVLAGPGLPAAVAEADEVGRLHPGARVLVGPDATVAAAVEAFGRHDLLHVAAHGSFRADNPSFSGIELADGPLTLLDLRDSASAPSTMVLPGCHLAGARLLEGDEPLGAVAGLVGLGVQTVVAALGALPDDATAAIMVDLHGRMAGGEKPAAAAAGATATALGSLDPRATAAGATLVVTGRRS